MNMMSKYFVTVPTINWKRIKAWIKAELSDFKKVEAALHLQQEAQDRRLVLSSFPKM